MWPTAPGVWGPQPPQPLRRNRRFQLLWIGALCSTLGMETASVAYPLVVLALTGSPAQAGLFAVVAMAAITAGALPAGDLADRCDQRMVMLVAEGARLLAVVSIVVAVALQQLSIIHLIVAAAVVGLAQVCGGTARLLVLRAVVPPEQLSQALVTEEIRTGSAQLAGPALGGFLYGLGAVLPFTVNAVGTAVSWVCAFSVRFAPSTNGSAPVATSPVVGPVRRALTGVTALWRSQTMRGTVLLMVALNVATAPVPLVVIVALTGRSVPPAAIGLAVAGLALGALAGTVLIRPLLGRLPPGRLFLLVGAAEVPLLATLAAPLGPYATMLVLFLSMVPIPALRVGVDLIVFRQAPSESRGRVIAAVNLALGTGFALGVGAAGLLLELFGVPVTLFALLGLLAVAVVLLATGRELRTSHWPTHDRPATSESSPCAES